VAMRTTRVGRRVRIAIGANVAVMFVLAALIVVLVNFFAGRRSITVPIVKLRIPTRGQVDLTEHERNTLSGKTKSILASLKESIECATFFRPDDPYLQGLQAEVIQQTESLLRIYERANPGLSEVNVVVLKQGSRQKEVRLDDLAELDRGDPGMFGGGGRPPRIVSFKAEEAITNALVAVTQAQERKVYFLRGHGEATAQETKGEGASYWADFLRKDGCRVEDLDLPEKRAIPEDASAVVALGPTRAFTPDETKGVRAYLERGGRLFLAVDPQPRADEAGEPTGLLEEWGFKLGRGIVCMPLFDILTNSLVYGTPQCAQVAGDPSAGHEITRPLAQNEYSVSFPFARAIERTSAPAAGVTTANLVETPARAKAWEDLPSPGQGWNFDYDKDRETEGVRTLAVAAEKEVGESTASAPASAPAEAGAAGAKKARLVLLGCALGGTNDAIRRFGKDFYMNAVNWLLERSSLISIAPKPPEERKIDLRKEGTKATLGWVCIGLFPALAAGTGTLVWFRRRR
jgi:hypothetical protein